MSADTRTGWAQIRAYCTCGGSFSARSDPPAAAEYAHDVWVSIHSGPGHSPTDQRTAAYARRKKLR